MLWPVKDEDMASIKEWLATKPHLPQNISDEQLSLFIYSCYHNLERAKKTVEAYYELKSSTPEFFSNRDLAAPGLAHILNVVGISILPERTKEGYAVMCAKLINTDSSQFYLDDSIKLLFMVIDSCLRNTTETRGMVFLFDNSGVTLSHLTRVSLSSIKKYFLYIQEAMPVRLKSIHIVNVNTVMSHIMTLIKPFIKKEHMKYIQLYQQGHLDKLYDMVPKKILPIDYGGECDTTENLRRATLENVRSHSDWFLQDETMRIDSTKKAKKDKSIVGSFRKLELD